MRIILRCLQFGSVFHLWIWLLVGGVAIRAAPVRGIDAMTAWPDHPLREPNQSVPGPFSGPLPEAPPPVALRSASATPFKGVLAYIQGVYDSDQPAYSALLLHGIGIEKLAAGKMSPVASYALEMDSYQSIHLSPDGLRLAYMVGEVDRRFGRLGLFLWDFPRKSMRLVEPDLAKVDICWSRDSRYLAFVAANRDPLTIFDTKSGQIQRIPAFVQGAPVPDHDSNVQRFSWTARGTLLYARERNHRDNYIVAPDIDVYEFVPKSGKSTLILRNAYSPVMSRDGKWLACFAWPESKRPASPFGDTVRPIPKNLRPGVYVCHLPTGRRWRVREVPYDETKYWDLPHLDLRWLPVGNTLIILERLRIPIKNSRATNEEMYVSRLQITGLPRTDVQMGPMLKTVAVMPVNVENSYNHHLIRSLGVSRDGQYIFLKTSLIPQETLRDAPFFEMLEAVDVQTGQVNRIAEFQNVSGCDWHEAAGTVN